MSSTQTEPQFNPAASIASAAAAESAEIINLLGDNVDSENAGSCCGGACCSA